jgi:hypothetical protein
MQVSKVTTVHAFKRNADFVNRFKVNYALFFLRDLLFKSAVVY